jgi:signal transduction histidine kinase
MHIASFQWVAVTLMFALLSSGLVLGLVRHRRRITFRLEQEQQRRLQLEAALHTSLARASALAAGLEQARLDERARIARDIHDDLGQGLLALKIELSMLQLGTSSSQPILRNKLSTMVEHLDAAIVSLRSIINNLRPAALCDGLQPAIVKQLEQFTRLSNITHTLRATPDAFEGNAELDPVIFRILQEALSNIARHAQATDVAVSLVRQRDQLRLTISDNGVGLPASASPHGCGLHGMRERAAAVGGQFDVYSRAGAGTLIKLCIPLLQAVDHNAAASQ